MFGEGINHDALAPCDENSKKMCLIGRLTASVLSLWKGSPFSW